MGTTGYGMHSRVFSPLGNSPVAGVGELETLEPRLLLSSVSGLVWEDFNADGVMQSHEPAMAGVTVYLDANANGQLDSGESFTQTNASGAYLFDGLDAGVHPVAVIAPEGYGATWQATDLEAIVPELPDELPTDDSLNFCDISADGRYMLLVPSSRNYLVVYDRVSDSSRVMENVWPGTVASNVMKISDDGRSVLTRLHYNLAGCRGGSLVMIDLDSGYIHSIFSYDISAINSTQADIAPDGSQAAYVEGGDLYVYEAALGSSTCVMAATESELSTSAYVSVAISPDGGAIATLRENATRADASEPWSYSYDLVLIDAETFTVETHAAGSLDEQTAFSTVLFSQDASVVGVNLSAGGVSSVFTLNLESGQIDAVVLPKAGRLESLGGDGSLWLMKVRGDWYGADWPMQSLQSWLYNRSDGTATYLGMQDSTPQGFWRSYDALYLGHDELVVVKDDQSSQEAPWYGYALNSLPIEDGRVLQGLYAESAGDSSASVNAGLSRLPGCVYGTIQSSLVNDAEFNLSGVIVYADDNANGQLDAEEAYAVSDSGGAYQLFLTPGLHPLRLLAADNRVDEFTIERMGTVYVAPGSEVFTSNSRVTFKVNSYPFATDFESGLVPQGMLLNPTSMRYYCLSDALGAASGSWALVKPVDSSATGSSVNCTLILDMLDEGAPVENLRIEFVLKSLFAGELNALAEGQLSLNVRIGSRIVRARLTSLEGEFSRYVLDLDALMAETVAAYSDVVPIELSPSAGSLLDDLTIRQASLLRGRVMARTSGDPGDQLAYGGAEVFLDLDADGEYDPASEPTARTNQFGEYYFTDLPAGDYQVGLILPDGATALAGLTRSASMDMTADFEDFAIGFAEAEVLVQVAPGLLEGQMVLDSEGVYGEPQVQFTLTNYGSQAVNYDVTVPEGFSIVIGAETGYSSDQLRAGVHALELQGGESTIYTIQTAMRDGSFSGDVILSGIAGIGSFHVTAVQDEAPPAFEYEIIGLNDGQRFDFWGVDAWARLDPVAFTLANTGQQDIVLYASGFFAEGFIDDVRAVDGGALHDPIAPGESREFTVTFLALTPGQIDKYLHISVEATQGLPQETSYSSFNIYYTAEVLVPGDVDGDQVVGVDDLIALKQHYNSDQATRAEGDLNGDGVVNVEDFILLKRNYNTSAADYNPFSYLIKEYNASLPQAPVGAVSAAAPAAPAAPAALMASSSTPSMVDEAVQVDLLSQAAPLLPPEMAGVAGVAGAADSDGWFEEQDN